MFQTRTEIASDFSNLFEIEGFIDCIMEDCLLPENYRGVISIPLMEAVSNAIVHGNGCDRRKKVLVICQQERKELVFSVSDEGQGFPYDHFLSEGGQLQSHGLSVILSLCEKVAFQRNGATILFRIPIPKTIPAPCVTPEFSTRQKHLLQTV